MIPLPRAKMGYGSPRARVNPLRGCNRANPASFVKAFSNEQRTLERMGAAEEREKLANKSGNGNDDATWSLAI